MQQQLWKVLDSFNVSWDSSQPDDFQKGVCHITEESMILYTPTARTLTKHLIAMLDMLRVVGISPGKSLQQKLYSHLFVIDAMKDKQGESVEEERKKRKTERAREMNPLYRTLQED